MSCDLKNIARSLIGGAPEWMIKRLQRYNNRYGIQTEEDQLILASVIACDRAHFHRELEIGVPL